MKFNFETNIFITIISLLIIGYFIYNSLKIYKVFPKKKFYIWAVLRFLAITFIVVSLMKVSLVLESNRTTTIFLVDRSKSVLKNKTEIEQYINNQIQNKKRKDKIGVISFGKDAMVDVPISENLDKVKFETQPNQNFTNIKNALEFSMNYFPEKDNKRLVLITDGKENIDNYDKVTDKLKENNINLVIYNQNLNSYKDAQLKKMYIPNNIHINEKIPVTITVNSNFNGDGIFHLFSENKEILNKNLNITNGINEFEFKMDSNEEYTNLKGEIDFKSDTNSKNNTITKTITLKDTPRVLVIGDYEDTKNINNLIKSMDLEYESYSANKVNKSIDYLSKFSEILLVNISYDEMNKEFEKNLDTVVKTNGRSLIVVGGEKSFALGGYKGTNIEKMLPVQCEMKGNKKHPNTGLVLVIDCSGSMEDSSNGIKKIEMAKEAAIKSVDILDEDDYVGVLAFSDKLEWVVPFQKAESKEKIKNDIGLLSSKGGTLIIPALNKTEDILKQSNTKVKHIILLSDGQAEKEGYEFILNKFKEDKITLSTVAVGSDSDKNVLNNMSDQTNGRSYIATNLYDIPNIFAKETYIATKKYLNNEQFKPVVVNETDILKDTDIPDLYGYTGTGIKKNANLILKSDKDDPILASWNYGIGKVIVFTSDLNGKWSRDWIESSYFEDTWRNIINYSFNDNNMDLDIRQYGPVVDVFVNSTESNLRSEVSINGEDYKDDIELDEVSKGKFKGSFTLDNTGDYSVSIKLKDNDKVVKNETRIIHLDYSPEYDVGKSNDLDLFYDADFVNGDVDVFKVPIKNKNRAVRELGFILLPIALCLFIADIGVRRML